MEKATEETQKETQKEAADAQLAFETARLSRTVGLAQAQLAAARAANKENQSAILAAKQELRENTAHTIGGLWTNDGFEDLAALSQYANPVTEKLMTYETVAAKIAHLERLIEAPYFARIDFQFDDDGDDGEPEKIYIGRGSLMEEEKTYEMIVYDWRSPIASIFYRFMTGAAQYEAPTGRITGVVSLKRQYEIRQGKLDYFFDADVQIVDAFLRQLLSGNTSRQMKAIVETIQKEQDVVIRDMENDLMMVQGVAGSGKTSVALHRAAYLMYRGLSRKLTADNILILSPNPLFEQYIAHVLPELGEERVVSTVPEELFRVLLGGARVQSRDQFLECVLTDRRSGALMKACLAFKTSPVFKTLLERFIVDLPYRSIPFQDVTLGGVRLLSAEALREHVVSGRQSTPLGIRLKQLADYIIETVKDAAKKTGMRPDYPAIKNAVRTFTEPDAAALYRALFQDRAYFLQLMEGLAAPEQLAAILTLTAENLCADRFYFDDASALAYLQMRLYKNNPYTGIKQVMIDEAQDYYPLHYELFRLLFPDAQYTVLGDINQTLEKTEDLSLYDRIGQILGKQKSTLVTMDKSFRCTAEILTFSQRFGDSTVPARSFNRSGTEPAIRVAADEAALLAVIVAEAGDCLASGCQSVGLICKTAQAAARYLRAFKDGHPDFDVHAVQGGDTTDLRGVLIIPVYLSKGLEFDAVLVCDADSGTYQTDEDKKLLYIACTRALHRLTLFCAGAPSPFLAQP